MRRRFGVWLVVAALFTLVNLAGAVYAAVLGEQGHAWLHVGLLFVGAYFTQRLFPRAVDQEPAPASLADERIDYLQQSVDAVALEVERIGEAQRFAAKNQSVRTDTPR